MIWIRRAEFSQGLEDAVVEFVARNFCHGQTYDHLTNCLVVSVISDSGHEWWGQTDCGPIGRLPTHVDRFVRCVPYRPTDTRRTLGELSVRLSVDPNRNCQGSADTHACDTVSGVHYLPRWTMWKECKYQDGNLG